MKAAASCYIKLIEKESDNNVKLIVLDRLISLKEHPSHERVLQDLVMDILCVLSSPDLEVRKKTLNLGNVGRFFFRRRHAIIYPLKLNMIILQLWS